MPLTRPPYPPEFRAEAVRLVRTSGNTQKAIADDLGVSTESLRKWVRQAETGGGVTTRCSARQRHMMWLTRGFTGHFPIATTRGHVGACGFECGQEGMTEKLAPEAVHLKGLSYAPAQEPQ